MEFRQKTFKLMYINLWGTWFSKVESPEFMVLSDLDSLNKLKSSWTRFSSFFLLWRRDLWKFIKNSKPFTQLMYQKMKKSHVQSGPPFFLHWISHRKNPISEMRFIISSCFTRPNINNYQCLECLLSFKISFQKDFRFCSLKIHFNISINIPLIHRNY